MIEISIPESHIYIIHMHVYIYIQHIYVRDIYVDIDIDIYGKVM